MFEAYSLSWANKQKLHKSDTHIKFQMFMSE